MPSFRHDIKTNNDLAEEIARVIGYNNIKSAPINLKKVEDSYDDKVGKLESFLVQNGFNEVINFPFTSDQSKESINIDNPLDSNRNNFRISLKTLLLIIFYITKEGRKKLLNFLKLAIFIQKVKR